MGLLLYLDTGESRRILEKTTIEIRKLVSSANLNFEAVENKALNNYLPKIFTIFPFTEDVCTRKQCRECEIFSATKEKH
jgi:hypothetical protein